MQTENPKEAIHYRNRALCHVKMEKWDLVVVDCERALELEESSVKARYLLGKALVRLNKGAQAADVLKTGQTSSIPPLSLPPSPLLCNWWGSAAHLFSSSSGLAALKMSFEQSLDFSKEISAALFEAKKKVRRIVTACPTLTMWGDHITVFPQ